MVGKREEQTIGWKMKEQMDSETQGLPPKESLKVSLKREDIFIKRWKLTGDESEESDAYLQYTVYRKEKQTKGLEQNTVDKNQTVGKQNRQMHGQRNK